MRGFIREEAKPIKCDACHCDIEPGDEYIEYKHYQVHNDDDCIYKMLMLEHADDFRKKYLPTDDELFEQHCDRLCDEMRGK